MPSLLYPALLFTHVLAATALCALDGVGLFASRELRAASDTDTARQAFARYSLAGRLIKPVPPVLLLSGLALCALSWGFGAAWIDLSLAGFLAVSVLVQAVDHPRLRRLQHLLDNAAPFATVSAAVHDPALRRGIRARHALIVWLLLLMTVKPGLGVGLAALLIVMVWALAAPLRASSSASAAAQPV